MAKKPLNWNDYEHGRAREGSTGSQNSRVRFSASSPPGENDGLNTPPRPSEDRGEWQNELRRRRSSMSIHMNAIAQAGGVNSIENFARSWQRAVGFHAIAPGLGSFEVAVADEDSLQSHGRPGTEERGPKNPRSLLYQQIEQHGTPPEVAVLDETIAPQAPQYPVTTSAHVIAGSPSRSPLNHSSHLTAAFTSSFGGSYGSLHAEDNDAIRQDAELLFSEQQASGNQGPEKEQEPLLVHRVEREDGKFTVEVIGQSTIYQTILNSTNVLIGVGILSLPLGIRYAGWLVGLLFLTLAALVTAYTAKLLGKCLDLDRTVITYSDIALISFGEKAELLIGAMFSFELLAACVALVVLFGDSLNLLIPGWGALEFKILAGLISLPLAFVPLRYLGFSSMLGIVCCLCIVGVVTIAGLIKQDAPGSLLDPAVTYLFPPCWSTLPLSFGLLMSPWGGHAVFPQLYRDMRHPRKYGKSLRYTFGFTYVLDVAISVVGLLMFGEGTRAEITSNIFATEGYPKVVSVVLVICISIIPLTKIPLNAQPIFSVVENLSGVGPHTIPDTPAFAGMSNFNRGLLKVATRIFIISIITVIAILCPSFDRVMSFMGSLFCLMICIVFPASFYLKLYRKDTSMAEQMALWLLIVIGTIMAIIGTIWAFLPAEITGAHQAT